MLTTERYDELTEHERELYALRVAVQKVRDKMQKLWDCSYAGEQFTGWEIAITDLTAALSAVPDDPGGITKAEYDLQQAEDMHSRFHAAVTGVRDAIFWPKHANKTMTEIAALLNDWRDALGAALDAAPAQDAPDGAPALESALDAASESKGGPPVTIVGIDPAEVAKALTQATADRDLYRKRKVGLNKSHHSYNYVCGHLDANLDDVRRLTALIATAAAPSPLPETESEKAIRGLHEQQAKAETEDEARIDMLMDDACAPSPDADKPAQPYIVCENCRFWITPTGDETSHCQKTSDDRDPDEWCDQWESNKPAADAEAHDRLDAAKDAVVKAAGECCNQCPWDLKARPDACRHCDYGDIKKALDAFEAVRDE